MWIFRLIALLAWFKGWRVLAVGGYVRDRVLGLPSKDLDLEVYGPKDMEQLGTFLRLFGRPDVCGRSFGVFKIRIFGQDLDVSLPRTDSKVGVGHTGFEVVVDAGLTPEEAAYRRDFTMNALAMDWRGTILDYYGGVHHLLAHRLVATSDHFAEDPLRVLRGMQFCGRFDLRPGNHTVRMCQLLMDECRTLSWERTWVEWHKWATKSTKPSAGLEFLVSTGWLWEYPMLAEMWHCPQHPDHHPEGDVFKHTCHTVDAAAEIATGRGLSADDRLVLVLAALCHDMGKAKTTVTDEDGELTSSGHAAAGATLARLFLARIGAPRWVDERVTALVKCHMRCHGTITKKSTRKLAVALQPSTISEFLNLVWADRRGRPPETGDLPDAAFYIWHYAQMLEIEAGVPVEILMGRHLIAAGLKPGRQFGDILRAAYDAQLDGAFEDLAGAKTWLVSEILA